MKSKKFLQIIAAIVILMASVLGYFAYKYVYAANTKFTQKEVFVHVPTGAKFEQVVDTMAKYVDDVETFKFLAERKSYTKHIKSGQFLLKKGMGNNQIINSLRQNVPVQLAFNNQERLEDFAGRIGHQIEADSLSLLNTFRDPKFLAE